jgi:hypothetical protein
MRQPLKLASFATKKSPKGAPREAGPSRHSLTLDDILMAHRAAKRRLELLRLHDITMAHKAPLQDPPGLQRM